MFFFFKFLFIKDGFFHIFFFHSSIIRSNTVRLTVHAEKIQKMKLNLSIIARVPRVLNRFYIPNIQMLIFQAHIL